jgi:RNA polymerase sigma-70 factor, ECF subfamily
MSVKPDHQKSSKALRGLWRGPGASCGASLEEGGAKKVGNGSLEGWWTAARRLGLHRGTRVELLPMAPDDDGELMLRYARGDMRAFETLYRRHRSALYSYLARHTRNTDTANDLFQEVWSKVIVSRERYEQRAQFRTFLYRIAHNCFIDHCRRASVRNESNGAEDGWEAKLPGSEQDRPDTRAEQAQLAARYRAALSALPAEQRDVFLLYESGLSLDEIAAISAVGIETAKSRLRYAVTKLRATLTSMARPIPANVTAIQEPGA